MSDAQVITENDLKSFSKKLEDWNGSLGSGEQALLHIVLSRAGVPIDASTGSEVQAFSLQLGLGASIQNLLGPAVATGQVGISIPGVLSAGAGVSAQGGQNPQIQLPIAFQLNL